ncbi:MAG: OadG family protein [Thermodesulfobacteriota bacterium]
MTGLEAISAHNGWSIALVGISIVFTGLLLLSLTISQLHKALDIWERRGAYWERFRSRGPETTTEPPSERGCIYLPPDVKESARQCRLLVEHLGQPFPLPKLLEFSDRCGLNHPHSTINELLLAGVIIPDGEGFYLWNDNVEFTS